MQLTTQGVLTPCCPPPAIPSAAKEHQTKAKPNHNQEKKETAKIICEFFVHYFWCFIFEGQGRRAYGIIMRRGGAKPNRKRGKSTKQILMHDKSFILFHFVFRLLLHYFFASFFFFLLFGLS